MQNYSQFLLLLNALIPWTSPIKSLEKEKREIEQISQFEAKVIKLFCRCFATFAGKLDSLSL
jgi:hypothetical protein